MEKEVSRVCRINVMDNCCALMDNFFFFFTIERKQCGERNLFSRIQRTISHWFTSDKINYLFLYKIPKKGKYFKNIR